MSLSPDELFNIVQQANVVGLADFKANQRKKQCQQSARQRADNILACLAAMVTKAATEGQESVVVMTVEDSMYDVSYYNASQNCGKPNLSNAAALVFDALQAARLSPVLQCNDAKDSWEILLYLNVSVEPAFVPPTFASNHHKALEALKDIINTADNQAPYNSKELHDNFLDILNEATELGIRLQGED